MAKAAAVPISACVIAYNEADRILACLESLAWCDEIVVVDSHSQDDTRARAASLGARVIERDWPGYAAQKQFAVEQARHDWVLCVDADERVSPALAAEIAALPAVDFERYAGWRMPRCTWYDGDWVRNGSWYPDWSLRLFDRRRGAWRRHADYDVHERVVLDGACGRLRSELEHRPYRDLAEHERTIERYTTLMAAGLHARGRRAGWLQVCGHPAWEWLRAYVFKRGFLDGVRGWRLARLHARYVRLKYTKLRALGRGAGAPARREN